MVAILNREIRSFFNSPIAYVLIGLFVLITSIFFYLGNLMSMSAEFNNTLGTVNFLLIFIIPILTMRLLSEDRKNGTEVLLITSPASVGEIVVGKYLSAVFVFLVMTVITFIYPIIIFMLGKPPLAPIISSYVGFVLLGAALISVGVFASSLTENQVIAVFVSFAFMLVIWVIEPIGNAIGGKMATALAWLSLTSRYNKFTTGLLDLGSIIFLLSFSAVFVFLTIRVIEKRRCSQG